MARNPTTPKTLIQAIRRSPHPAVNRGLIMPPWVVPGQLALRVSGCCCDTSAGALGTAVVVGKLGTTDLVVGDRRRMPLSTHLHPA